MNDNLNKIKKLIEFFDNNKNSIKSNWNETETRIELINPFFDSLGWDVNNNQKLADPFKEVKHEASLKIGSNMKAPDYSFNYGKRLFYLEAKKPSVDIKNDISPSYQLRRYGWTAKMPISILTDFEELAIYDCRIKPDHNDSAGIARIKYYTYKDYIDKWDEIYNFISKEAILHGALNDFENKQIKGTSSIDDDFLNSIENWRKALALNIALRNPGLNEYELNFAVQMIIDRIIFLRICEDRGIENYEILKNSTNNNNCYENLLSIFQKADDKYNSGLFHFKTEKDRAETPDNITPELKIDDKVLKDIIKDLYYPCPYAFDVISSDVLGSVYERFLGKVITLKEGTHRAHVDYKPEVRKAGGVYYTPHYIVQYIVKNTLGEILNPPALFTKGGERIPLTPFVKGGMTPDVVQSIKILDPACGSGSFLIEAYECLLDWHLNYYINNDPEKWKKGKEPKIFDGKTGLQLTLSERKKILINNIYGVDIDKNAVEVTKLSLLLKALEYEGQEVQQKLLFTQRILPDLYKNIKCGNSLIGSDFYKEKDLSLFGNDEMRKVNVFDWEKEFPEVFESGGFDCVIGNPPYIPLEMIEDNIKDYFLRKFSQIERKYDSSILFILSMLNIIKSKGLLSFISSVTWQTGENYIKFRQYLFNDKGIIKLVNLPFNIFKDAYVDTGIYILTSQRSSSYQVFCFPKKLKIKSLSNINYSTIISDNIKPPLYKMVYDNNSNIIINKVFEKENTISLGDISISTQGLAGNMFIKEDKYKDNYYPFFYNGQIYRYYLEQNEIKYTNMDKNINLKKFYEDNEKILIRRVINRQDRLMAMIYNNKMVFKKDVNPFIIKNTLLNPKFILGIINSKLFSYIYIKSSSIATKDDFRQTTLTELRRLPIININFSDVKEKYQHDKLVSLVDQILDTQKQISNTKTDNDIKMFKQKIDIIDKQIDELVYKLYGLTDEEIGIVVGEK